MLSEISIQNLAIIDRLQLRLGAGMGVLTGETGAGKSIIIDAVSLLLGGRAVSDLIRAGTDAARVEGVFRLDAPLRQRLAPLLEEYGLETDEDTLILSREINRSGRNICRINGRAVTLALLRQVGQHLVDIHGQGEHMSLLSVRQHVDFLDRYAGLHGQREELAEAVRQLRQVRQELNNLLRDERELARRVDLLEYQIAEIRNARLQPDEEEELQKERLRLTNAERLITLATASYEALAGGGGRHTPSALDLLNEVTRSMTSLERLDADVAETRQTVEEALELLQDVARALRDYREMVEYNPVRLEAVEERLELIHSLKRKYGGTIAEVLEFGRRAAEELESISHNEERVAALRDEEQRLLQRIGALGDALSTARQAAARRLERAIEEELAQLRMGDTRFVVDFRRNEVADGAPVGDKRYAFDATGLDQVEFLISPNVGEPPKPLALIASGGETSRLMLAMKSVLSAADEIPTLIFDEIDVGIGGRAGGVVGEKLWSLTREHQVLCVTHLPQIAAFADCHYRISKEVRGERTVTVITELDAPARLEELTLMLGGAGSQTARQNAAEMLAQTQALKEAKRAASPTAR